MSWDWSPDRSSRPEQAEIWRLLPMVCPDHPRSSALQRGATRIRPARPALLRSCVPGGQMCSAERAGSSGGWFARESRGSATRSHSRPRIHVENACGPLTNRLCSQRPAALSLQAMRGDSLQDVVFGKRKPAAQSRRRQACISCGRRRCAMRPSHFVVCERGPGQQMGAGGDTSKERAV